MSEQGIIQQRETYLVHLLQLGYWTGKYPTKECGWTDILICLQVLSLDVLC